MGGFPLRDPPHRGTLDLAGDSCLPPHRCPDRSTRVRVSRACFCTLPGERGEFRVLFLPVFFERARRANGQMKIQIYDYEFVLTEPYSAGKVIDEVEARVLNSARAEKIRNALYRRISKKGRPLSGEELIAERAHAASLDMNFVFEPLPAAVPPRGKELTELIIRVARERVALGEGEFETLINSPSVIDEATRIMALRREAAKLELEELLRN